jgi:hypothetical protein
VETQRFGKLVWMLEMWRSRRAFLIFLVAISMIVQIVPVGELSQAADKKLASTIDRAVAGKEGRERGVAKGDVIAQGRRIDDQARSKSQNDADETVECDIPETRYGLEGKGPRSAAITLEVTDDCQLVVASIEVNVDPPEGLAAATQGEQDQEREGARAATTAKKKEKKRQTGGWHEHKDVAGLILTEAYAHIKYRDDGKKVSDASGQLTYCRNALDGWHGTGTLGDWSVTNGAVWIWKRCGFSFVNGNYKHELDVDVYSWPGNEWDVFCTRRGNTVPGAKFKCGRAHEKL